MYSGFAYIYDELILGDINYNEIADFIEDILPEKNGPVLDLACGTGNLTTVLAQRGYDMIGIDASCDMLSVARQKNSDILYLCQDMRALELSCKVDAAVCTTDSLNYLTNPCDLELVFKLVKKYLNQGAPFIFDMNSLYKLEHIIGNNTFTYDDGKVFYVWENQWDSEARTCEFFLNFFVKQKDGLYRRFDETHIQRAYSIDQVKQCLQRAGFCKIYVYDGYTKSFPHPQSQRIVYKAY